MEKNTNSKLSKQVITDNDFKKSSGSNTQKPFPKLFTTLSFDHKTLEQDLGMSGIKLNNVAAAVSLLSIHSILELSNVAQSNPLLSVYINGEEHPYISVIKGLFASILIARKAPKVVIEGYMDKISNVLSPYIQKITRLSSKFLIDTAMVEQAYNDLRACRRTELGLGSKLAKEGVINQSLIEQLNGFLKPLIKEVRMLSGMFIYQ